jgi:hypothetical protein
VAKRRVNIPLTFGAHGGDIDKKHAPFGFLKTCKNLRMRERGRLGTRRGYDRLTMTTRNGTLVGHDLHAFRGRPIVFGSDRGAGVMQDVFELTGVAGGVWRGTDELGDNGQMLSPFTNARERCGILQIADGAEQIDGARSSAGRVALAYRPPNGSFFAIVTDGDSDQVILHENLRGTGGAFSAATPNAQFAVRSQGARFYVLGLQGNDNIRLAHYEPGTHARFTLLVTPKSTSDNVTALDLCAVGRASTHRVVVAYAVGADVTLVSYNAAGAAQTTITFTASASVVHIAVEADETDDTLNVYYVETPTTGQLRTYSLSGGALLDGPTATVAGATGSLGRLFAQGAIGDSVVVAVNTANNDTSARVVDIDTHATVQTITVENVALRSRVANAQTADQDIAFCVAGLVSPDMTGGDYAQATNALFYVTPNVVQAAFRDFARARDPGAIANLQGRTSPSDAVAFTTAWLAAADPGVESDNGMPVLTLVDCMSAERRQTAEYGGLLFIAGASVSVYDGRAVGELGFGEAPGVVSLSGSNGAGSLTAGATYYYAVHWEIVLADGSLMVSPVSVGGNAGESITDQAATVTLGASEDTVNVTATAPHSVRIAASDALLGAAVNLVVSRTQWISLSTTASLLGTRNFTSDPAAAGDFDGETLELSVNGGATQTVTFGANDNDATEIAAAINAQTTGLVASVVSGYISLETESEGASASIEVVGGTAAVAGALFVGFLDGASAEGETNGAPGSVLRRVGTRSIRLFADYGTTVIFTDTVSDDDLADNEPIYTQADRGVLSGPLEQHAPRACRFIAATESRLLTGGLAREYEAQISREAFLSEPFSFSEFSSFFCKASGPLEGVESLDSVKLLFTRDRVFALPGEGPDDLGGGGLGAPVEITSPGGLKPDGWRSFLKVPEGLFYQDSRDQLMLLPRGAGSPVWAGEALATLLASYPTITGAARSRAQNAAVFALTNETEDAAADDARTAGLDFRVGEWCIDTPPLATDSGIDAIIDTDEGVAYLSGGVVFRQGESFYDEGEDAIDTEIETHPIYPFGVGGHGQVYETLFVGEYEGDCTLTLSVSLDDGQTYTALTAQSITGSAGGTVKKIWTLPECVCGSIAFRLAKTGGAGTGGVIFNDLTLLVEDQPGLELLPTADYG